MIREELLRKEMQREEKLREEQLREEKEEAYRLQRAALVEEMIKHPKITVDDLLGEDVLSDEVRAELDVYWDRCGDLDVAMILGRIYMPLIELERMDYNVQTLGLHELKGYMDNRYKDLYVELVEKLREELKVEGDAGEHMEQGLVGSEAKLSGYEQMLLRYHRWGQMLSWEDDLQELADQFGTTVRQMLIDAKICKEIE